MKRIRELLIFLLAAVLSGPVCPEEERSHSGTPFVLENEELSRTITTFLGKAWAEWQDSLVVNNIEVDSSRGVMAPGNISGPVLKEADILSGIDMSNMSGEHILCAEAVAGAIAGSVRSWQRGFFHHNIPFPRGASCSYTLPLTNNVPVTLSSGASIGDNSITEEALYGHMLHLFPEAGDTARIFLRASAGAFAGSFDKWKDNCSIEQVRASGGIAPAPAPIGTGPGPVVGAKGSGGKIKGAYLDTDKMYQDMVSYIRAYTEQ